MEARIRRLAYHSPEYESSFRLFLSHTDQKAKAKEWLGTFVKSLPRRRLFVDVGAGAGSLTQVLSESFDRSVAIEPNPTLRESLRRVSGVEVIDRDIDETPDLKGADLVLCSHVFYLVPASDWARHVRRLAHWLAPGGALVVINQSPATDCRIMVAHFYGPSPEFGRIVPELRDVEGEGFSISIETIPSYLQAGDRTTALGLAEFVLNGFHEKPRPLEREVLAYLDAHFSLPGGGYRFSCHQDCLILRRRA